MAGVTAARRRRRSQTACTTTRGAASPRSRPRRPFASRTDTRSSAARRAEYAPRRRRRAADGNEARRRRTGRSDGGRTQTAAPTRASRPGGQRGPRGDDDDAHARSLDLPKPSAVTITSPSLRRKRRAMSTYECSGFAARPFATHTVRGARPAPPSSPSAPRAGISPATGCRARGSGRRRRTRQLPTAAAASSSSPSRTTTTPSPRVVVFAEVVGLGVSDPTCRADTRGRRGLPRRTRASPRCFQSSGSSRSGDRERSAGRGRVDRIGTPGRGGMAGWAHRRAFVLLVAAAAGARCADAIIISVRGAPAPPAAVVRTRAPII